VRILVTGGHGFIGSHIVEALAASGHEVVVLDRNPAWPGPDDPPGGVEVQVGDLRDPAACRRAVAGVDAVCHQAAKVGLGVDFADVTGYVDDNGRGTAELLAALWDRSFAGRLVLAGSMVVYGEGRYRCPVHGDVAAGPRRPEDLDAGMFEPRCPVAACGEPLAWTAVGEDSGPDPRNVYAATKLHQEHLCGLWAREAGATAVSLRYHNVYGPRLPVDTPYAGVAAIFRTEVLAGRPPRVTEDGGQMRDFVHVRDVAAANVAALTRPGVAPGPCNVGSGTPRSVGELAAAMSRLGGAPAPVVTGRWRLGDVRHVVASSERAATTLGFRAAVGFDDGVAELLAGGRG
jgi:dTDP-L-rhamnose 4-epimerase